MNSNKKEIFIISEVGVNHNGSLKTAKKLIKLEIFVKRGISNIADDAILKYSTLISFKNYK